MAAALGAGALACGWGTTPEASAGDDIDRSIAVIPDTSVTIAILPRHIGAEELARVPGMSVGSMSAGLSNVTAAQTYLDIGQGNRVFTSLYDGEDAVVLRIGSQVPNWRALVERAESAPADIVPGLLASSLAERGIPARADPALQTPALIAADRDGAVARTAPGECVRARCPGLSVVPATLAQLPGMAERLRGDDLLIAIERPPPPIREPLAIGVAGDGFGDGNLTSDTTRGDGYVTSTDVGPTVLERLGIPVSEEMSGQEIRSEGEIDAAGISDRAERMTKVSGRRKEVILYNLMIWAALAALAALATRGRVATLALSMLGLSTVYIPLVLLVTAALLPTEMQERLIVGLGAPALAALTLLLRRGWDALAIAAGLSVGAIAVDVALGSTLTTQSLLGPNPGLGVRFFGIGNELEATIAILVPVGVGAGLSAYAQRSGAPPEPRTALIAFLAVGGLATALFAAGRFGADVGAAIVLPVGAVVAALAVPGAVRRRRTVLILLAAPVLALALLALLDLALGGDAHLSRSVLDAGGADQLGDVFERRLRLSAASFERATEQPMFWFALGCAATALVLHRRVGAILAGAPLARAGFAGALAATLIGIVANDSGALFLVIGNVVLLACLFFAWAQRRARPAG